MNKKRDYKTQISIKLSQILRHKAQQLNIPITKDGYVKINDILKVKDMKGVTQEFILQITREDKKGRFSMKEENENIMIRANQGHSMKNIEIQMKEITNPKEYPTIIHGTFINKMESIMKTGLNKMNRQHIHMCSSLPNSPNQPKSGIRYNTEIIIYINLEKALNEGLKFFESENGVILCEGPLESKYFDKILYYPSMKFTNYLN